MLQSIDEQFQGNSVQREYRIVRPDGSIRWTKAQITTVDDETGHLIRFVGVAEDITARKQTEAALIESETRFRTMADSAPVLLWVSGTDALCNFFNQTWLNFTGRTMEQEMGYGWLQGVHPQHHQIVLGCNTKPLSLQIPPLAQAGQRKHHG